MAISKILKWKKKTELKNQGSLLKYLTVATNSHDHQKWQWSLVTGLGNGTRTSHTLPSQIPWPDLERSPRMGSRRAVSRKEVARPQVHGLVFWNSVSGQQCQKDIDNSARTSEANNQLGLVMVKGIAEKTSCRCWFVRNEGQQYLHIQR
jgi:hypothetical protein